MPTSYSASITGPTSPVDAFTTVGILVVYDAPSAPGFIKFTGDGDAYAQFALAHRPGLARVMQAALDEFDGATNGQIDFEQHVTYPADNGQQVGLTLVKSGDTPAVATMFSNGVNCGSLDVEHLRNFVTLLAAA